MKLHLSKPQFLTTIWSKMVSPNMDKETYIKRLYRDFWMVSLQVFVQEQLIISVCIQCLPFHPIQIRQRKMYATPPCCGAYYDSAHH